MTDTVGASSDMDVSEEVALWELLEDTPAGVELAKLVASVDRDALGADEVLLLAAARQRLVAHWEAQTSTAHRVDRVLVQSETETLQYRNAPSGHV